MDTAERARQIAETVEAALVEPNLAQFTVRRRGGCSACDPGKCVECGYLFTGELFEIDHPVLGKRVLSDKAIHYLAHGIHRYETGWIVHGEPVVVDLDVEELAHYLNI
jgi:hypothetical protein